MDESSALTQLQLINSGSWRQYPAYAKSAVARLGAESRYVALSENLKIIAMTNLRVMRVPGLPCGIAVAPQGPVIMEGHEHRLAEILGALRGAFVKSERLTLRLNFPLCFKQSAEVPTGFNQVRGTGYSTVLVDLNKSEDALIDDLDRKWRSDLYRAQRNNITITRSSDPADFRKLQPLLKDTSRSKGFAIPMDADFFAQVAAQVQAPEHFAVHLAWHKGRLLGGHIGAYSGDTAVYLLGASNSAGRDLRAAFLLQWEAIKYARSLGLIRYDLGGVDPKANPGVFRFKRRMGGLLYNGPDMIEAKPKWPYGSITQLAERARKTWAH